jgi:anti-sigma regulatory factor (Ser/Thr protein kinase)
MSVQPADLLSTDDPAPWVGLPATPAAAGLARRFLARALSLERPDVVDVIVLLTSELVANAVVHGREPIRLQLHRQAGTVRIEVHDGGLPFTAPAAGTWSVTDESGRGLRLLDALASSWGSHSNGPALAGKTLWFELAGDDHGAAAVAV